MTAMDAGELDQFRTLLEARRAELLENTDLGRESARTVELDQARVGRLSRMDAMQQQAMAQATARRRTAQLQRIDAALQRLDHGDYGECTACGKAVARRRLEIDPAALLCIHCAEKIQARP